MPKNITVKFADGSEHIYEGVPDDVSAEAAEARVRQDFPNKPAVHLARTDVREGFLDNAIHKAKLFGSDVVKGVAALPAFILDANAFDPLTGEMPKEFGGASKALQGSMTKPETEAEKWQSLVTQGAAGAVATPGGVVAPIKSALVGGTSAATSEGSARLFGEGLLQRLLGGLGGGWVAGSAVDRLSRAAPNTQTLAREATEGIDPKLLEKAKAFMEQAKKEGVDVDLAQALEAVGAPAGNMTTLRNVLYNSKEGNRVQQTLRDQPTQLSLRADLQVARMPGTVWGEAQAANNLQETASGAIDLARKTRTASVRPFYDQAGKLDAQFRLDFKNDLSEALQQPGLTKDAARAIQEALAHLKKLPATGGPISRAADYDEIIRSLKGAYKGNLTNIPDPKTSGQLQSIGIKLGERLRTASPMTGLAADEYARISQQVVNPLKQGPVGQLAGRGYKPDVQASIAKMNQLFKQGVDPQAQVSPIKTVARELAKVDRDAFADAAKTYYSARVAEAFEPVLAGASPTNAGAAQRLWDTMFSNSKQYQGMKDTVTSVAETYGLDPRQAAKGLENFAQIVKALKSRPAGGPGGLSREEVFRLSGKNYGADALRIFGFLPFEKAARRLEDRTVANAFRDFDNILTTPEGAAMLIKLSQVPVISDKAITILATVGGTAPATSNGLNSPGITAE